MATQNSASPDALNLASRLDLLHQNGHGWMDPALQVSLASGSSSNSQMLDTATTYKNATQNLGTGLTSTVADGTYNKPLSPVDKALSFIHNVHGPVPVYVSDVAEIQKNLQAKGYGQGLQPGTWNPQWNQALNQHATDQLNAPGVGNVKSLPLWKKVIGEISPSGWSSTVLHAIGHYITTLPEQGRQLVADVGGEAGNYWGWDNLRGMITGDKADIARMDAATAGRTAAIENALGGNVQASALTEKARTARAIGDLGNLLNLLVLKGTGGALAKSVGAVGAETAASMAAKDTALGAAKTLVTRSLPEEFAATPRFTVVKSLYQGGVDGEGTGLLSWMENKPVLKRMLPAIDAMDAEGSKYFTFKTAMGESMRIPARQVISQLQSKGSLAGLGLLGSSAAQDYLGGQPTYDATKVAPYSGILGNALDVAGLFAGAPTKGLSTSQNVGKLIDSAHGALSNAAGSIGIDVAIKKGLGISLKDLQDNLGHEFVNDHFINTKLNQYAASHYAEQMMAKDVYAGNIDKNTSEAQKTFMNYEHDALNDPEILSKSRESLILQPTILGQYYKKDFANILGTNVRKGINDTYDVTDSNKTRFYNAMQQIKALHEPMSALLDPQYRNLNFGSATFVKTQDAITKGLAEDWGKKLPEFDWLGSAGNNPRLMHINNDVNEFSPDANKLIRTTRYGTGVTATEDTGIAGRANANIYALRHTPADNELPKFWDTTKVGSTNTVSNKIKSLLGGAIDAPAGAFSNNTTRQYRDELGLMVPGKGKDTLVNIPKENYPKAYKDLRKMLKNPFDYSSQQVLDAYRNALVSAGKLDKPAIDARMDQVTKSIMEENGYTGFHYYDDKLGRQTILNPDRVSATMVKQDPKWSMDSLIPTYLQQNNIVGRGALGVARKDTFVAQDAQRAAGNLFKEMSKLGHQNDVINAQSTLQLQGMDKIKDAPLPNFTSQIGRNEAAILKKARSILTSKLGYSPNEISRLDPIQAISEIYRASWDLASESHLPIDVPQHLKDAVEKIKSLGYRPVLGTDIGHSFEAPLIHPAIVNQKTSVIRKAMINSGFDITKVSDIPVAQARRTNVENEVNKLFASGKVAPLPGDNGNSVYSTLLQHAQSGDLKESLATRMFRGAAQAAQAGRKQERIINQLMGDTSMMTNEEKQIARVQAQAKVMETFNKAHTIRDLSLKEMVKALTKPVDVKDVLGNVAPRYQPEDAMKIAKAVLIGYAKTPASMVGIGKAEDFIRASNAMLTNATASFFGKVPVLNNFKIGEGRLANAFASLPNDLAVVRDKWRFDNNPVFAFRRLAKTNVKAAAEGVPVTRDPWQALTKQGALDSAFNTLQRTMPDVYRAAKDLEPLDKFLQQADVFGIYNPAHMMAWQAHNLEKLGLSDAEITQKLTKINTYGERTPLERTVNTIFYPFSFNKTLYRSVGGYILDHPGETMLINAGFGLYQHFDPNNDFGKWVTKYAPILNEAKKLNAFEHGTGLGQFGGINAPYINEVMNLFSPQRIVPTNAAQAIKTWTNLVPALGELNTLLFNYSPTTKTADFKGSAVESLKVVGWSLLNLEQHAVDLAKQHQRALYQTTLSDKAQVQAGLEAVTQLKVQLANIMGTGVWPNDPAIPAAVRGQKINASSIGQYAHALYPAYDPSVGTALALQKSAQAKSYVASLDGTFRYDGFNQFQTIADKAIKKLNVTKDPASIQDIVNPLREAAVNLAEQDAKFAAFYRTYYQSAFGPIEGLTK